MKTYLTKNSNTVTIDAKGRILGRLATEVATILRGKNKPNFAPNKIVGDLVVVENADLIKVTGAKLDQKTYYRHTGYLGNMRSITLKHLLEKSPEKVIEFAVYGMLPNNRLRSEIMKRLTIKTSKAQQ